MRVFFMTKLALVLLAVSMSSAGVNAFGQRLYPVQGPLAAQTPPPVFSAKLKRPLFGVGSHATSSGSITWILANDEKLQGKLVTKPVIASSPSTQRPGDTSSYPPQPNLAFAWDAVFGQGYYVAHILGKKISQSVLTGDQGTVLQVETYDSHGVAVDNRDNIFKLVY
jgi:hypothetical protein